MLSGVGALVLALLLGGLLSGTLVRPASTLAAAADGLAAGDFDAPLPETRILEFDRVTQAFSTMRRALAQRLTELEDANRELASREQRLTELQTELIRRDRLATAGQLVGQLAHEVRNPVANVRNCLELLNRRMVDDDARELIELATDELLRMHELAERVLDLHRPAPREQQSCDAAAVARNAAALMRLSLPEAVGIQVTGARSQEAAIPPDTLKQVLMTLLENASEAMAGSGGTELRIEGTARLAVIEVTDTGPGIPDDVLPRIFDPFFTTKDGVQGVGLGLFVAEGLVRSQGGRIVASNTRPHGARFRIELPVLANARVLADAEPERVLS
jgi:two-component system NtrC family sensor kinase